MQTLSVIIPAYNEERTIRDLIARVQAVDLGIVKKDIIVVDDASKDTTREIVKSIPGIRSIFHERNLGKGGALKTGIRAASGDFVIFQDADLEYDPMDYPAMIQPMREGNAAWTNGVRIAPTNDPRLRTFHGWLNWLGNHTITWITNLLYRHNAREYEGCYKAFPKSLLDSVEVVTNDFDFDNELVCKLLMRGIKPVDVPIHYTPRDYGEGKHIHWKHGFKILGTIVRLRLTRS